MSRALRHLGTPLGITFPQLIFGAVTLMSFAVFNVPRFTPQIPVLALMSGVTSMLGNSLLIMAYTLALATRMAPFIYTDYRCDSDGGIGLWILAKRHFSARHGCYYFI